jgi:hypothetical protein
VLVTKIEALFNKFQEGFNHFDLVKVIDCYHVPCTLNTPDKMSLINTTGELENEVDGIFAQLVNEHFVSFQLTNTSFMRLTDELIFVNMDWKFIDKHDQVFSEFSAFYHLTIKDKKLKIINVTSHQISNGKSLGIPFFLSIEHEI